MRQAAPFTHQIGVVGRITSRGSCGGAATGEELAGVLGQALGEEHPDRDAISGGRIVVPRGVADEEDPAVCDGTHPLVEVRSTEWA